MARSSSIVLPSARRRKPYSPRSLGALVRAWYDDTTDVGVNWDDRSGKARHLVTVAGGLATTTAFGRRAVQFDGATYAQTGAFTSADPVEYWLAVNLTATNVQMICEGRSGFSCRVHYQPAPATQVGLSGASTALFNLSATPVNRWVVLRSVFNGAASQLWENGVLRGTGDIGTGTVDPGGFTLGAGYAGYAPTTGYVGEALVTSPLSATQAGSMFAYLMRKWL